MSVAAITEDGKVDAGADEEIHTCINANPPKSFFLFAGAGSGKTRSLMDALDKIREKQGRHLWLGGRKIAVITYTNAARDEIQRRLEFDSLVEVSTIHSFAWLLIGGFNSDIREWLRSHLAQEIAELVAAQGKGRAGTKTALDRAKSIENKNRRLSYLDEVKSFTYNPTGDNRGRDALNHSEVIGMTASFLTTKRNLAKILVNKYPILLIDESQDTNKHLMDAFLVVQKTYSTCFCLGLFGDTMQRIYADGKVDLPQNLPADWARPAKKMNHRCPARIVQLANKIRSAVDGQEQKSRGDNAEGIARLFIVPAALSDKLKAEGMIANRMATITGDRFWSIGEPDFKTLILEHHMAAKRMGFLDLFEPLYKVDRLRIGLLDGSLAGLKFFTNDILPLVEAKAKGDEYAAAAIVRKRSPLLDKDTLKAVGSDQPALLRKAKDAVNALMALWRDDRSPSLLEVLRCISVSGLFEIPEGLRPIAERNLSDLNTAIANNDMVEVSDEDVDVEIEAWERALGASFQQMVSYAKYISRQASFDTHQGVKGLEFPRVMVIMDDDDARGFLFSYDKLFGVKDKSETDIKNERAGVETSVDRTRRLFYVTCTRAKSSLAIVAYSKSPQQVKEHALAEGWFTSDEIETLHNVA